MPIRNANGTRPDFGSNLVLATQLSQHFTSLRPQISEIASDEMERIKADTGLGAAAQTR
jgi:hypothetical protein